MWGSDLGVEVLRLFEDAQGLGCRRSRSRQERERPAKRWREARVSITALQHRMLVAATLDRRLAAAARRLSISGSEARRLVRRLERRKLLVSETVSERLGAGGTGTVRLSITRRGWALLGERRTA